MKTLNTVDTERMKRVLDRLYPEARPHRPGPVPPPPPPPERGGACALMERETQLERDIQNVFSRSRECRRTLQGVYARSEHRARELRSDCFLHRGERMPPPRPRRRPEGVLSMLREIHSALEDLGRAYEKAAAEEPRRRERYGRFSDECGRDARSVRQLIERVMR